MPVLGDSIRGMLPPLSTGLIQQGSACALMWAGPISQMQTHELSRFQNVSEGFEGSPLPGNNERAVDSNGKQEKP